MPRYFISPNDIQEDQLILRDDMHHILHVLRLGKGDVLEVCDGAGTDYKTQIAEIQSDRILCNILEQTASAAEAAMEITLFQGLPKSDKMEWILQKGTELGISSFVPVAMQRSVVRYDANKDAKKNDRFQKIAESAAKQSGRGKVPKVGEIRPFRDVLQQIGSFDLFLVPYEKGQDLSLKQCLNGLPKAPKTAAILIGPEGGFAPEEIADLEKAGACIVGLGPRILRTETAGPVAAAMLLYHYDQI